MTRVVIPGSFDPPTNGHLHLIERASNLFPEVCVLISVNGSKESLFSQEERADLLRSITKVFGNVTVDVWDGLVGVYAKEKGHHALLRGLRSEADFAYELDIANINHSLSHSLETLFLPTRQDKSVIRSSYVKELWSMGTVVDEFVPEIVARRLRDKLTTRQK
ncbi:pantetheine-phosphate adenylyltransferase [Candidatus Haliotispira prima]|uniref:Phosphopantetheine adenylyltransferase n=1 Tax=Candidatus Haliotispira prima TaxID=3034016 RepID=A0ABY8MME5_9SPIO|nr:pantetheine-phosphate adenylyltransferase [Candidatus Haliotispira prima]